MNRVFLVWLSVWLGGCDLSGTHVRIGAKEFPEQMLLAEILQQSIDATGSARTTVVVCGDTYRCHRAMREGRIDVMIDYTGTGLAFVGVAAESAEVAFERVADLYAPLGIRWHTRLGFDNSYAVLVDGNRAALYELGSVGDLTNLEQGVRVACPPTYVQRPSDGLAPLLRRYGIQLRGEPLLVSGAGDRYDVLDTGRVDAVIGYTTDGAVVGRGLTVLDDNLGFFPPYDATIIVQDEALRDNPFLAEVFFRLENQIDVETMQRMNYAVEVEGRAVDSVAWRFLREAGLVDEAATERARTIETVVTMHEKDALEASAVRAMRAVRDAFPKRSVRLKHSADPIRAVVSAKARFAVMGAERFFVTADGLPRKHLPHVEAVAVLGTRMVHLLRRSGEDGELSPFEGRIGVSTPGSGSAAVASEMLELMATAPALQGSLGDLLGALRAGALDAVVVLEEQGHPELTAALVEGGLELRSVSSWLDAQRALRLPYLRPARIPSGIYPGQEQIIDTLGAQTLLVASAEALMSPHRAGPLAAMGPAALPLSQEELRSLADAIGFAEVPDPVLPSPWSVGSSRADEASSRLSPWADTMLNLLVMVFFGAVAWLTFGWSRSREITSRTRRRRDEV